MPKSPSRRRAAENVLMLVQLTLLGCTTAASPAAQAGSPSAISGRSSVIDGDTIEIHGQRIRLHGIDAPEGDQSCLDGDGVSYRCGQKAALALADLLGGQTVSCLALERDRFGRIVAQCHRNGIDIAEWMVSQGLAVAYRRFSDRYVVTEDAARTGRLGVWQGRFMMPWEWRAARR
jgi:endonuclease YncB( thermonuclease family)